MRDGSNLAASVGKGLFLAATLLISFICGCRQSPGSVHKLKVDPAQVDSIVFDPVFPQGFSFVLHDRGLISRVVDEINGLSFTPYSPSISMKPIPDIVLKDKDGDTIIEVGGGGNCVFFWEPLSPWFCVKKDGSMETAGRLLGYNAYLYDMDSLKFHANQAVWDGTDGRMASSSWKSWVTELYPEPYRSWPVPGTPEELSERLKSLPILTLDELDRFPNYFD